MKTEKIKSVKVEFEGEEVDTLKSLISKVTEEATKTGFQKTFNSEEISLIKEINDKIK